VPRCRRPGRRFSVLAGVGAVWESAAARAARPPGGGRPEGVRGNRETGLWGISGFPRCLQLSSSGGRGAVCAVIGAPSAVISAAGTGAVFGGGRNGGLGENLEPGRGFAGPGGFRVSPSAFPDWSLLLSVYLRSRAVVFLTSPSCLVEGVRSGTRRRRGASASAQAGGETGPGTRRTAPARAGGSLYGRYAAGVRGVCVVRRPGAPRGRCGPPRAGAAARSLVACLWCLVSSLNTLLSAETMKII